MESAESSDVMQRREVAHQVCFVCGAPGVVSGRRPGTYVSGGSGDLYGIVEQKPAPAVCEAHRAALDNRSVVPRWCATCTGWRAASPCPVCHAALD